MARLKTGSRADLLVMKAFFVFALTFWPLIRVQGRHCILFSLANCTDKIASCTCLLSGNRYLC